VKQKCRAQTKAGEPCKAVAVNKGLCTFHADPQKAAELGRSGGRKNRRYSAKPDTEGLVVPRTVEDVKNLLAETMACIYARRLDPKIGSVLGYLGAALLKAMEATDLEKRIVTLEQHGPQKPG
jgi:hypothetical protein